MSELEIRRELAALYRIADILGWSDNIFTHITARVPGEDAYLINSYGLLFDEVTASNLVKVDLDGNKLTEGRQNKVASNLHSIIHRERKDINCIIHTHTPDGIAVSCDLQGLLPLSQQSLTVIDSIAYHEYEGVFFWQDEQQRLISDLGNKDILILRNHGLVATAGNIPSCFSRMYMLESACKIQTRVKDKTHIIDKDIITKSLVESLKRSNSQSTILMWQAIKRKLDKLCPDYKN